MHAMAPSQSRKRAVNLTLSPGVVDEAKRFSGNLSATVEELLAEYVAARKQEFQSRREQAAACVAVLNELHDRIGSFADEHSPL